MMAWSGLVSKAISTAVYFCLPFLNNEFGHVPLLVTACLGSVTGCIFASMLQHIHVAWMIVPLILKGIHAARFIPACYTISYYHPNKSIFCSDLALAAN